MNIYYGACVSKDSEKALSILKTAVCNALKKKRMLGQYSVVWDKDSGYPKHLNYVAETNNEYQV